MTYTLQPATIDDAIRLHIYLSDNDREELRVCQVQPLDAITRGVFDSDGPVSVFDRHGTIAAIAGVVPVTEGVGAPWMLTSDAAKTEPLSFVKQARLWVQGELARRATLKHEVYRCNTSHIKLLQLLGFTVEKPRAEYPLQLFLQFSQSLPLED